jgi:hypothetical protein
MNPLRGAAGSAALVYPDGMGPSPSWVLDNPAVMRHNGVDQFCAARTVAFTNLTRNNIKHFNLRFNCRKQNRLFAINEGARGVSLHDAPHHPGRR